MATLGTVLRAESYNLVRYSRTLHPPLQKHKFRLEKRLEVELTPFADTAVYALEVKII